MSAGLISLLDDVAAIARLAAASLDDVVGHAAKASAKSAGVVIDDAAVTPRYVVGFAAERELPIVGRIARGSLKNKLLYLLPAALLLAAFAPWAVTPLLMLGGCYLCFEGAEKVHGLLSGHHKDGQKAEGLQEGGDAKALEDLKVAGAIRTDFILSAEIMAIALAAIPDGSLWERALALALVAVAITVGVYGAVALIVKADDLGVALARQDAKSVLGAGVRAVGRGLVRAMPGFLKILSAVGTAAMIWVGGGILIHGLEEFGVTGPGHAIHHLAEVAGHAVPVAAGAVTWIVAAACHGVVGLGLGLLLIPVWNLLRRGGGGAPH